MFELESPNFSSESYFGFQGLICLVTDSSAFQTMQRRNPYMRRFFLNIKYFVRLSDSHFTGLFLHLYNRLFFMSDSFFGSPIKTLILGFQIKFPNYIPSFSSWDNFFSKGIDEQFKNSRLYFLVVSQVLKCVLNCISMKGFICTLSYCSTPELITLNNERKILGIFSYYQQYEDY